MQNTLMSLRSLATQITVHIVSGTEQVGFQFLWTYLRYSPAPNMNQHCVCAHISSCLVQIKYRCAKKDNDTAVRMIMNAVTMHYSDKQKAVMQTKNEKKNGSKICYAFILCKTDVYYLLRDCSACKRNENIFDLLNVLPCLSCHIHPQLCKVIIWICCYF